MTDTTSSNETAIVGNTQNPQRVAILTAILLIVSTVALFWIQERSVIKTCLDLTSQNFDICFAGMNSDSAVVFDSNFKTSLQNVLEKNASNNGVFYGLLASLIGGVAALLCVVALPANQLQFTGNFEKSGGKIRVGGAVGIFLLFAFGGGWLAYANTPGQERETLKDQALDALLVSQSRLTSDLDEMKSNLKTGSQQHSDLISNLSDNTDDFALSILKRGYFSQMNGQFEIDCENPQTEHQKQFLRVDVPGFSSSIEYGVFGIPLDLLLKPNGVANSSENETNGLISELHIDLTNSERLYVNPILAKTNFRIFRNESSPTAREVRMHTKIVAKNIADYCSSKGTSQSSLPKSVEANPLASNGGS